LSSSWPPASSLQLIPALRVTFQKNAIVVLDKQQRILARGVKEHCLFRLVQPPTADYTSGTPVYAFAAVAAPSLSTWHHRFGHLSQQAIRWLAASRLVGGLELESGSREHLCDACAAGKAHRLPFPASPSRSTALLDLVHSDLMQLNTLSLGGARYLFTLLDDHSKKCCDMALMRYWSLEYCDWRVAPVTDVGEEVCAVLDIFLPYFYAFY
jgi:hypothetical protein